MQQRTLFGVAACAVLAGCAPQPAQTPPPAPAGSGAQTAAAPAPAQDDIARRLAQYSTGGSPSSRG